MSALSCLPQKVHIIPFALTYTTHEVFAGSTLVYSLTTLQGVDSVEVGGTSLISLPPFLGSIFL